MHDLGYNQKQYAEDQASAQGKLQHGDNSALTAGIPMPGGLTPVSVKPCGTLREETEKIVGYHRAQADKHDQAAAFFRDNPVFDQFVRLIRSGVIQI